MIKRRKIMEKGKVLVIDDEDIVLKSVNKILSEENYEVDVSSSGRQGIDRAIERSYDVVLTDIRMPDIGGMRVLRDIKRAKPSLAVIIITGYATVKSAVQAMKLGAVDYLEKPFTPDQLLKAVASALDITMSQPAEDQALVHKEEMLAVLERAASDKAFAKDLLFYGADILYDYNLSGPEKLAILTGDIAWIEEQIGPLAPSQRHWLELRKNAEIW
jgi:DNA-binding NtrC family response regulator